MMPQRVLFYDDMPAYGGHQVMTAFALEALAGCEDLAVTAAISPENQRNRARLEGIARLELVETLSTSGKLEGLRSYLRRGLIGRLAQWLKQHAPALVVAVQGDIEGSCLVLHAARAAGVPCVSYIPVPHRLSVMQARLGQMRDLFNAPLFQLPRAWITISPSMEALLRSRGAKQPVHLVRNGVDIERLAELPSQAQAREALGLPVEGRLAGLIGRIEFKQKQQDFAVETWATHAADLGGWHLALAGSGPDEEALRLLIAERGLGERVHLLPWQASPLNFYAAIDCLTIPSRYEGVPLVMLEALAAGVPVVGSDRDGMRDILPEPCRFAAGDASGFARAMQAVEQTTEQWMPGLRTHIRQHYSLAACKQGFVDTVRRLLGEH